MCECMSYRGIVIQEKCQAGQSPLIFHGDKMTYSEVFMRLPEGEARLYTLTGFGMTAKISDFGGVIRELLVPAKDGSLVNVAMGYANPMDYYNSDPMVVPPHFGALIGRVGNRIGKAKFMLDGREVHVFANERGNSLHGGQGFHNRIWDVVSFEDTELHLRLISPDGDAGYPGELTVDAIYRLTADHALEMVMTATTDAPTVVNLTNHNYFNLAGEDAGSLLDQSLRIYGSHSQEVDADLIPTGKWLEVTGTPLDFRQGQNFREAFAAHPQGFDDNYLLDLPSDGIVRTAAEAYSSKTGIRLEVQGISSCVQLYTSGGLDGSIIGTGGKAYPQFSGFCLEMQAAIDAPNHPEFPSIRLAPGETYRQVIRYRFSS